MGYFYMYILLFFFPNGTEPESLKERLSCCLKYKCFEVFFFFFLNVSFHLCCFCKDFGGQRPALVTSDVDSR